MVRIGHPARMSPDVLAKWSLDARMATLRRIGNTWDGSDECADVISQNFLKELDPGKTVPAECGRVIPGLRLG